MSRSIFDFEVKNAKGDSLPLREFENQVLLIVNVASRCGFTPQYEGLEKLQKKYGARGFKVLGFPCNQFGAQEPGTDAEIQRFCQLNYSTTFPVMAKIEVNGPQAHPLYQFLKSNAPGVLGTEAIKWNFTKFLVNRQGQVVSRYAPTTKPESLEADIEALL
jgi:glutathione peroxidase